MKVILSTGHGRLHLVQSATWLRKAGVDVTMLTGWIPKHPDGWLVKIASKLARHNLVPGMKKRQVPELEGHVITCTFAEMADECLRIFGRIFKLDMRKISVLGWKIFGRASSKKIKHLSPAPTSHSIFHVRSGAGHGGAIETARKLGMKIVVDHSIAHPAYMERELKSEYEKRGVRFDLGISSPFWQMIDEDCQWADKILVNSFFVRDTFVAEGYDPKKIEVAYLGVRSDFFGLRQKKFDVSGLTFDVVEGSNLSSTPETSNFKPQTSNSTPQTSTIKLLFTGGFGFRKGGEYILEALKIVNEKRPDSFTMDFVGSYEKTIVDAYKKDNLPIIFHGPVPQENLKSYLANSDIYVFPSLAEGCASSGMEAMAAGMCVVATHESGFPITDGENGYLVPTKNAQAIADRILWLMDHPEEIDRVGANAAKLICENYTWEKYAEKVKKLYEELVDNVSRIERNSDESEDYANASSDSTAEGRYKNA